MTRILSEWLTKQLDNDRFVAMAADFTYESDELAKYLLARCKAEGREPTEDEKVGRSTVRKDFVMDGESVPIVRGRNVRGGGVHDNLSCYDSVPVVPKSVAAAVYREINAYCDEIDAGRSPIAHVRDFSRRWAKWSVVYVWPGYFHKRSVNATCKELFGFEGDKYVTVEKLNAAIKESEQATEAIKDIPAQVEQKADMVSASEQVTTDLKDAKEAVK